MHKALILRVEAVEFASSTRAQRNAMDNDVRLANAQERGKAVGDAEAIVRLMQGFSARDASNALIVTLSVITMQMFPDRIARRAREQWVEDIARAVKKTMIGYEGAL